MASNEVYFCTDKAAVEDGTTLVASVYEGNFQPGALESGRIYYWKANEVNDAAAVPVREGNVWEFSTVENLLVDDFEGYTDDDPAATQTAVSATAHFGTRESPLCPSIHLPHGAG